MGRMDLLRRYRPLPILSRHERKLQSLVRCRLDTPAVTFQDKSLQKRTAVLQEPC